MTTITTADLAREVGMTPKTIRAAINRGDLLAVRVSKGSGRTKQATEFVITRRAADDWKVRRTERTTGVPMTKIVETQERRRHRGAYFDTKDVVESEELARDALKGDERAREQLRQPWEQGGLGLTRWWNREAGDVV